MAHAQVANALSAIIWLALVTNSIAISTLALMMETVSHRPVLMQHAPIVLLITPNKAKINTVITKNVPLIMIVPLTPVRMEIVPLVITIHQVTTATKPNVPTQTTACQVLV